MNEKTRNWKKMVFGFIFAVLVIVVYKLLDNFKDIMEWVKNLISILMPFIMAVIMSYLFYLPCRKIEAFYKKRKRRFIQKRARWLAIFTVYLIAIIIIILIIKFIVPTVYESLTELITALPGYYKSAIETIENMPEDSAINQINLRSIIENMGDIKIEDYLNLEKIGEYAKGIIEIATGIFDIFVTVVVSMYLLAERSKIVRFAKRLCNAVFNKNIYTHLGKYFRESNEIFFRFISSQIIDAVIVGVLTSIAMSIMGVKYGILLGFMIGLFNLIPFLGAIIAIVLAIIITIFTGGISQAIWMAIVVIILQQIDANIINPKILGDSLEISPILIIFSITVIGAYFGIIGMFLAVPIVAIIKLLINDYIRYKECIKGNVEEE
ncbi:MAG: AI-2E family transporter [Clostridia bacterium]|jgi:predicted PurR-regulated permease PerM|nr:AI-2E family transporter [Clostridia bacterium]